MMKDICRRIGVVAVVALAAAGAVSTADAQTIQGTATFREQMALPPGSAFEALLEDVSRPGSSALVVGYVRVDPAGNPPITFTIPYDKRPSWRIYEFAPTTKGP